MTQTQAYMLFEKFIEDACSTYELIRFLHPELPVRNRITIGEIIDIRQRMGGIFIELGELLMLKPTT